MASIETKRNSSLSVDYKQLRELSSATLYDSMPKKRGRFYEVERIITRRATRQGYEYLLKWQGWPYQYCSWEPAENLTPDLVRSYLVPPQPSSGRLEIASRDFLNAIQAALKGKSMAAASINIDLDVWRFITANKGTPSMHRGYTLYSKEDFGRFKALPNDWHHYINEHGEGRVIDFPIKAKPMVSWSPSRYNQDSNGKLRKAPRVPIEKVVVHIARRACNVHSI